MHLYTNGTWETTSSILDKTATDQDLYQKLGVLGFQQSQEVVYRGGKARLYTRVPQQGKTMFPLGFDFCCVLYLGRFLYTVGLKSLQDVLRFYQEIDAHVQEMEPLAAAHLQSLQQGLTNNFSDLADRLEDSSVSRNLSTLEFALEQLNSTLSETTIGIQQYVAQFSSSLKSKPQASQRKKSTTTHF